MERKNYRPVTVLNAVNKVFEQLQGKQVVTKVDLHLSQNMSAHRKHHSCQMALIKLVEDWIGDWPLTKESSGDHLF